MRFEVGLSLLVITGMFQRNKSRYGPSIQVQGDAPIETHRFEKIGFAGQ
jgi:hypothetical protein